jgi:hypothetical protein
MVQVFIITNFTYTYLYTYLKCTSIYISLYISIYISMYISMYISIYKSFTLATLTVSSYFEAYLLHIHTYFLHTHELIYTYQTLSARGRMRATAAMENTEMRGTVQSKRMGIRRGICRWTCRDM